MGIAELTFTVEDVYGVQARYLGTVELEEEAHNGTWSSMQLHYFELNGPTSNGEICEVTLLNSKRLLRRVASVPWLILLMRA